jgi:hypothetical protein
MDARAPHLPAPMIDRLIELDVCDRYIVLVVDPQTFEADALGPFDGVDATGTADRLRRDFDGDGLGDVQIAVCRLHQPVEADRQAA